MLPRINNNYNQSLNLLNAQNQALNSMLGSVTGGLNLLSRNKDLEEQQQYKDYMNNKLNNVDNYTVGKGTINEHIDPLRLANGNSIRTLQDGYTGYINPNEKQTLFTNLLNQHVNDIKAKNNDLLNQNKIKQMQQQQYLLTAMQQDGDVNKDGIVDYNDLNQQERNGFNNPEANMFKSVLLDSQNQAFNNANKIGLQEKLRSEKNTDYNNRIDASHQYQEGVRNEQRVYTAKVRNIQLVSQYNDTANNMSRISTLMNSPSLNPALRARYAQQYEIMKSKLSGIKSSINANNAIMSGKFTNLNLIEPTTKPIEQQNNTTNKSNLLNKNQQPSTGSQVTNKDSIFNKKSNVQEPAKDNLINEIGFDINSGLSQNNPSYNKNLEYVSTKISNEPRLANTIIESPNVSIKNKIAMARKNKVFGSEFAVTSIVRNLGKGEPISKIVSDLKVNNINVDEDTKKNMKFLNDLSHGNAGEVPHTLLAQILRGLEEQPYVKVDGKLVKNKWSTGLLHRSLPDLYKRDKTGSNFVDKFLQSFIEVNHRLPTQEDFTDITKQGMNTSGFNLSVFGAGSFSSHFGTYTPNKDDSNSPIARTVNYLVNHQDNTNPFDNGVDEPKGKEINYLLKTKMFNNRNIH